MFCLKLQQLSKYLILSRGISTALPVCSKFSGRDILDFSHGESGTLSQRFIKYIALESCKFDPLIPQKIKYADYFPVNDFRDFRKLVKQTDLNQFPRLLTYTYTYKTNGDPVKTAEIINEIDSICCQKINEIDNAEMLRILYAFMYLIPNKVANLDFYWESMKRIVDNFDRQMLTEQFVQVCYYLGLSKKNHRSCEYMNKIIQNTLSHYLNDLTRTDFAIVSNAAYKTGTVINDPAYQERLVKEILTTDPKDDAILVTLLKSLRLNRIKSEEIYTKLTELLMDSGNLKEYHFKGLAHIFACFAEGHWNDPIICEKLITECRKRMENVGRNNNEPFNDMRAKDISTFVWSVAHLGLTNLTTQDLSFIEEIVLKKADRNEFRRIPDEFIDICLSLWMLNHKSRNLLSYAMEINGNQQIKKSPSSDRIKLESRVTLFFNCVHLENPDWLNRKIAKDTVFKEARQARDFLIKNRKALKIVDNKLAQHKDELTIKTHKIVSPIQELNVAGIFMELDDGRKCYMEVLEENQIMKYQQIPASIAALKIRLLENLGYHVIVIDYNECLSPDSLQETLKNKIHSVPASLDVQKLAV